MEKALFWLKITRKGAAMLASILLFVGILLDLIFRYLGISSLIGFKIVFTGILFFAVFFALSIAISFISDKLNAQKKKDMQIIREVLQEEGKEKKLGCEKFNGFISKYENAIKLFFYTFALCLTVYFSFNIITNTFFWEIYFYLCLFFWVIFLTSVMEFFYSKDKKTYIVYGIALLLMFGFLIWNTVLSNKMYFDAGARVSLKSLDILALVLIFLSTVLTLVIASDNQILKVKHTRNFGIGLVLMCAGICMYFVQPIAAFILKKWDTTADLTSRVQYLTLPMNICMYIIIALTLLSMLNVAFNTTHYIKTKNWLGILDIIASFVCVVLSLIGILSFANFIAYLK